MSREDKISKSNQFWTLSRAEIVDKLHTDLSKGLSTTEVQKRLEEYGPNQLAEERKISFFKVLIHEIFEPMILLLFAVGIFTPYLASFLKLGIYLMPLLYLSSLES